MSLTPNQRCRNRRLRLESLERREVLAAFGTAWPDSRSLTVSFPTDNTQAGAYQNSLRSVLDQVAGRQEWQEAVLRAFQTWAVQANINIGLADDRGDNFGAVGLTQKDPRFGDFRIGAIPQIGVLANATPFQTNAGTWAGDVLINSQVNYFLDKWEPGVPVQVPPANEKGPAVELFSVLLHEAGNALGLADVNLPGTVMHKDYLGPIGALSNTDRRAIWSLYGGPRKDIFEPVANNTRATATIIDQSPSNGGTLPVVTKGSLNTSRDSDFYRFTPLPNQETATIRLRANGISLLKSRLIVSDSAGNVIADAKADSVFANDLQLEIGSLRDRGNVYIQVVGNGTDVFTVGDYQLEIDYRPTSQQPVLTPLIYDADAVDDDSSQTPYLAEESVDRIFANAGLIDVERFTNDTRSTATRLQSALGFNRNTRYETIGSLTHWDTDFLVFRSPAVASSAMSIRIESLGLAKATIHAKLLDRNGNRVPAKATPQPDGSVTFLVNAPARNADYYLQISAKRLPVRTGNYVATVDFSTANLSTIGTRENVASGTTSLTQPTWSRFQVYKTQLFRFDLGAAASSGKLGLRINVYDAKRATLVFSIAAAAGSPQVAFAWLQRGVYAVRIEGLSQSGVAAAPVRYALAATGISDDQGPLPIDPTDPYSGQPPIDPYGGVDPGVSAIPDPYGGANPFPFPNPPDPYGGSPPPTYDPPEPYDPWYFDPYYGFYSFYINSSINDTWFDPYSGI
jgi:Matrixin